MNLVDTTGWIEYFFAGKNARFFSEPIEKIDRLLVPVICLYEVFKKINQTVDEAKALQAVAQMKQGKVVPVGEDVALKAALISLHYNLPMADSFIYAIAQQERAWVWTQDEHFKNLPQVKYKKTEK